jgi:hypothetical protein
MKVSDQVHTLTALDTVKEPLVPSREEAGWAPQPVWMFWRKEKSLIPVRIQSQIFWQTSSEPIAMPTVLSWLPTYERAKPQKPKLYIRHKHDNLRTQTIYTVLC